MWSFKLGLSIKFQITTDYDDVGKDGDDIHDNDEEIKIKIDRDKEEDDDQCDLSSWDFPISFRLQPTNQPTCVTILPINNKNIDFCVITDLIN